MKNSIIHFFRSINFGKIPIALKIYFLIAILAPVLANEKPLFLKYENKIYFPAFSSDAYFEIRNPDGSYLKQRVELIEWRNLRSDLMISAPVSWSAGHSDLENGNYCSPFSRQFYIDSEAQRVELPFFSRHFLGTTRSGEDVLAGLIHGTRISIWIGFASMFLAALLGVLIGGLAGFYGDYNLKMKRISLFYLLVMILPAWYYSFTIQSNSISLYFSESIILGVLRLLLSIAIFITILIWPIVFKIKFNSNNFFTTKISIPVDFLVMRLIEIFLSLPRMVLILTIAAITRPSVSTLVLIIGLTSWTDIARMTRAELLKLREVDFISAEKSIGLSSNGILLKHILPNITPIIITVLIYGVASAIMLETGLSFLGIGLPAGTVTWGTLMFAAKENFSAWWLVLFPGIAISVLLISLNKYGRKLG